VLSLQEPEQPLRFKFPKFEEVEAYVVKLEDGRTVIRTKDELEKPSKTGEKKEKKE